MSDELPPGAPESPPRRNGELVFQAPWERRIFGIAMALHEAGRLEIPALQRALIEAIAGWRGGEYVYYEHFTTALERLLCSAGLTTPDEIEERIARLHERPHGHDH